MKKIFKKALSVFLATLMCLAVAPAFAFAADEQTTPLAPVFSLDLKSETSDEVAIVLTLKENSFNCLDLTISSCENLTLSQIEFNIDIFITGGSGSTNISNGKISFARAEAFVPDYELVTYTFTKSENEGVSVSDFTVTVDSCGIGTNDALETTIDVTESVVINNNIPSAHTHTADGDWFITAEPTCENEGEKIRYCGICGEVAETEKIPVAEHTNLKTEEKEPTCTEAGYKKEICLDCGKTVTETPINPLGHGETTIERLAPTCKEDGYIKEICLVCNQVVSETPLPSSGHRYITDIKVPTCTEDGYVQSICPACQDVNSFISQPKTGHSWLEWTIVKQPTYSKEGIERRVCNTCGIDEERSIPKLVATPTELVMSMQEIGMNYKQTTRLFVNVLPEEAAYSAEIIWESSNPSVATVDEEGAVYAVAPGTATITAKTADGKLTATCEVTVKYSFLQWIIIYILFGWIWYV